MDQHRLPLTKLQTGLPPASPSAVLRVIADISSVGGRFELGVSRAEAGWRPLTDLLTDPGGLEAVIRDMAGHMGTDETRVAASILFQKVASRLCSPAFGAAVAHGLLIGLDPRRVHWHAAPDGVLPLRVTDPAGWEVRDPVQAADALYRTVVIGLLEPLGEAVRAVVKIAPGLLWGNAASALAGTMRALVRVRPELTGPALTLGRELLDIGPLRDTGELAEPSPGHPFFVRRSCCLYYRVSGDKCGDCGLTDPGAPRDRRAHAVHGSRRARPA
ncbi:(2Fe-2S)-binding protein [Microtetraspora fusca]|uniref:(2Fe-2S)-binding protein n=1 Tax=Microtetraspora fusca TaxID=1997 RepID=A0ABW6UWF0_MICFU